MNIAENNKISLRYGSYQDHNAQIVTGFDLLTDGKCCISSIPDTTLPPGVVLADVNGTKIAYDTCDGYYHTGGIAFDHRYKALSEKSEILYKRDYNAHVNPADILFKGDIRPLGLNYFCHNDRVKRLWFTPKARLKHKLSELTGDYYDVDYRKFEAEQKQTAASCEVLFLTRIWDPVASEIENQEIANERMQINETRIAIIRELKKRYGSEAICGLNDDAYARRTAPDLIVPTLTKKVNYVRIMKRAKVAIASLGLHSSNGWKTGEYVAAGRAIVMERPYYEIPYARNGVNWLEYTSVDECLHSVEYLLSHNDARIKMEDTNQNYYSEHLRPDKLIYDTLADVHCLL